MNTIIKTLTNWYEFCDSTGKHSIYDYLHKGDIVSEDIIDYFINLLPPRTLSHEYIQVGEPYNHVYDIEHKFQPTYMTFANCDDHWR